MKKSFMTRVVAVSLSAAMTFSLSATNMLTASAATKYVALSAKSVTLKSGAKKTLKLKNNSLKWKVTSATSARKDVVTVTKKSTSVVLKAKNCKKTHKNVKVTVKLKTNNKKKNNTKKLVCKVTVKKVPTTNPEPDNPNPPADTSVKISSATVTSKTNVDVKFSGPVDRTTLVKENFKIAEAGVTVENVEARDGISVTLTLAGAEAGKTYTLNVTGLKDADGKAIDALSTTFTMPADTTEGYHLKLTSSSDKNQIKADGYAELPIVCEVVDPNGNTVTNKNYTIRFTTDRGSFSRPDVVTTNGKTENVLKSQALDVAQTAHVTAEIIRVEGTDEEGLRGKKGNIDINMTPILDSVVSNPVIGAESNYADRLTLFFQDPVEDDTYKVDGNGKIDSSKIKIEVFNNITAQQAETKNFPATASFTTDESDKAAGGKVVNLRAVTENNRALQVLVDSPLQNNRHVGVRVQITDPTTKKTSTYVESFVLTDSETPRVLKVEPEGRRTLRVTYSEAVLPEAVAGTFYRDKSAEYLANYLVGGRQLSNEAWGNDPYTTAKVGSGLDGEEDRNVVTIKLGERTIKDSNNDDIKDYPRFDVGENILTVQNVGDWASRTSGVNNIITTDTKTFTIEADTTQPAIKDVEVQSPEQFLVTFNAPVAKVLSKDFLEVKNSDALTAKAENGDNVNKTSIIQLQEDGKNIGAANGETDSKNPIRVTKISDEKYLVETTKDWTQTYAELGSTNDDYFYNHRYKLVVAANKLINKDNGEKNTSETSFDLADNAVMRAPDTTAPTMVDMTWNNSRQRATVTFNEPIKVREPKDANGNANSIGLNDEGSTPSVKQRDSADRGVQQSTAQFISPKTGRTIKGKFVEFTDSTDMSVVVEPEDELTSSDDWTLHISGISDDYGNTGTVSKTFAVTSTEAGFKVAWASVSQTREYGFHNTGVSYWNAGNTGAVNGDRYIFVKFTNAVNRNSILFNASSYSINSNQIPSDAYVLEGIKGYDDQSGIIDSVTIVIPARSAYIIDQANGGANVTLTISDRVTSGSGQTLGNLTEMALPYNHAITGVNTADDAVYGNDTSENSANLSESEYKTAVENAIKSDKYRKIKLQKDISGDLDISRPVDIDLNGFSITGTAKAAFNDGAKCDITNSNSDRVSFIKALRINTPNADWTTTNGGGLKCEKVDVRAMPSKTFTNDGATIDGIEVNSGSLTTRIVNKVGIIGTITVDSVANKNVKVQIKNLGTINKVAVKNASTIEIVEPGSSESLKAIGEIEVLASKDVTVNVNAQPNSIGKLTGKANNVTIKSKDEEVKTAEITQYIKDGVENTNTQSMVDAIAAKLKGSYEVPAGTTSGGAVKLSNIVTDMVSTIDKNGSVIPDSYSVKVAVHGTLVGSIVDGAKFVSDMPIVSDEALSGVLTDKKITVYLVKSDATQESQLVTSGDNANAWLIKNITITQKQSN